MSKAFLSAKVDRHPATDLGAVGVHRQTDRAQRDPGTAKSTQDVRFRTSARKTRAWSRKRVLTPAGVRDSITCQPIYDQQSDSAAKLPVAGYISERTSKRFRGLILQQLSVSLEEVGAAQVVPIDRLTKMDPEYKKELRQLRFLCILGFCLVGVAIFAPNTAHQSPWSFFQTAKMSTWRQLYDWPAAWCSVKIILLSLGLLLVIDATESFLALVRFKSVALFVLYLQVIPALGILAGSYYLLKALL